jgi:hypothetical protein
MQVIKLDHAIRCCHPNDREEAVPNDGGPKGAIASSVLIGSRGLADLDIHLSVEARGTPGGAVLRASGVGRRPKNVSLKRAAGRTGGVLVGLLPKGCSG